PEQILRSPEREVDDFLQHLRHPKLLQVFEGVVGEPFEPPCLLRQNGDHLIELSGQAWENGVDEQNDEDGEHGVHQEDRRPAWNLFGFKQSNDRITYVRNRAPQEKRREYPPHAQDEERRREGR